MASGEYRELMMETAVEDRDAGGAALAGVLGGEKAERAGWLLKEAGWLLTELLSVAYPRSAVPTSGLMLTTTSGRSS